MSSSESNKDSPCEEKKGNRMKGFIEIVLVAFCLLLGMRVDLQAQSSFYQGKTVQVVCRVCSRGTVRPLGKTAGERDGEIHTRQSQHDRAKHAWGRLDGGC